MKKRVPKLKNRHRHTALPRYLLFSHEKERRYLIESGEAASKPLQVPSQKSPMKNLLASSDVARFLR